MFPTKSAQFDAFLEAASVSHHECDATHSMEEAVQLYFKRHHSVVVVDTRPTTANHKIAFDAEGLCRYITICEGLCRYTICSGLYITIYSYNICGECVRDSS